jgi:hypothetical protein
MTAARTAVIATTLVFLLVGFYTLYLGFVESPLRYEALPWLHKDAGHLSGGNDDGSNQFLIGVGKADITG